jgi:hypothetical protein
MSVALLVVREMSVAYLVGHFMMPYTSKMAVLVLAVPKLIVSMHSVVIGWIVAVIAGTAARLALLSVKVA